MKLCIVGDVHSIHVKRFAHYFFEKGYDVHVVTHAQGKMDSVFTHYIGPYEAPKRLDYKSIKQLFEIRKRIRKTIDDLKPDLVHALYLQDSGFFAALSHFHPLVVTALGSDVLIYPYKSTAYRIMTRHVLKKADAIHSVGDHLTKKLVKLGASLKKIITVPLGVDLSLFHPDAEPIMKKENIIVSTRSLKPIYNVQLLIKAMPNIIKEVEDVKVIIVGDGEEKDALVASVRKLKLGEHMKFVGAVKHEEIPRWLRAAKVYVSTSLYDGTSISLLEAMVCGVFPVVSDIEANSPWIKDGENGFLVPPDNPELLARRIVEAIGKEELRESAKNKNIGLVRERADWQDNLKKIEELYQRMLKGE